MAASRVVSSGKEYIASASIMLSSDSETIDSNEYNPSGVEADKSILGIGRSALTSSCKASNVNPEMNGEHTLRWDILSRDLDILVNRRGEILESFCIYLTA
jgi:hypothetical protein